ncbi:hypothetical protein [Agromyces flavus]|uniref:hypothetical protein n=1 Tax=Agromyces flavus TaxID=589382 RepID=UPI0036129E3D
MDLDAFRFYLGAVDSIECIEESIRELGERLEDPADLFASYESARLSIIGACWILHQERLQEAPAGLRLVAR